VLQLEVEMRRTTCWALMLVLLGGCAERLESEDTDGGSSDGGVDEAYCRAIGNQPPCCEFFGHRETPEGLCEEGVGLDTDAGSFDAGGEGAASCERNDECASTGSGLSQCCPGGVCDLGPCVSGPAPPPACEARDPSDTCGDEMVCVNDATCGFGTCRRDCRVDGDCAARGLVCAGDQCAFDCTIEGFAGCRAGEVCRENGQCGAPLCDSASCGPAQDCMTVTSSQFSHLDDGCRPKPCSTSGDCPGGTFCINGGCAEQPGMCGDATPPP